MENLKKEIRLLIQKSTLRDVEIKLKKARLNGMIIPDVVFELMREVEDSYDSERSDEGELTPEEMQEKSDEAREAVN